MRAALRRHLQIGLVTAISLVCLVLAFRKVPLGEFRSSLAGGNYVWLALGLLIQPLGFLARSWRWVVLLGVRGHLADSFWAQSIGYLFTNVLPFRMGEPARVLAMSQRCKLPFFQVASSAVIERLMDGATCVLALGLVLPLVDVPAGIARAGLTMAVLAVLGFAVLIFCAHSKAFSKSFLPGMVRRIRFLPSEKLLRWWGEIVAGLAPLKSWRTIGAACLGSALTWSVSILTAWFAILVYRSTGTLVEATFMIAVLAFAVSVPSSPGFIGVFQLAGQQALVLPFGDKYDPGTALAITLVAHVVYYVFSTTLGAIGLWKLGLSYASMTRVIESKRETPAA